MSTAQERTLAAARAAGEAQGRADAEADDADGCMTPERLARLALLLSPVTPAKRGAA